MAFAVITAARLLLSPSEDGPLTTRHASLDAADRRVAPSNEAFDTGLRPDPFPDRAASLLPGLLAATRTGLTPAGDDELVLDQAISINHLQLWARARSGLIHEMADRWTNLATLDSQIVSKDSNAVYIDIGTHGDPAYDIRTNGTYDSYIPQLVMSSCDVGVPSNQCTAAFPPSFGINCPEDDDSPWVGGAHFTVRMCPDTADLINQAVAALWPIRVAR